MLNTALYKTAPRLTELCDKIFTEWGGVEQVVRDLHETYVNAPVGSQQRMKVLQFIMDLVRVKNAAGQETDELDQYDEQQLQALIRASVKPTERAKDGTGTDSGP